AGPRRGAVDQAAARAPLAAGPVPADRRRRRPGRRLPHDHAVSDLDRQVRALFARHPTRMVPDLDRIRDLAELLDHPEATFPSIQVTGTNGKTTTTAMITALLGALGLSAGGYTSPHLQDV